MSENCSKPKETTVDFFERPYQGSDIKKVIGIVSDKGGVGKSLVTALLAVITNRRGHQTAILDADVTESPISKVFGIDTKATVTETGILPVKTKTGINIISENLLLDNEFGPVIRSNIDSCLLICRREQGTSRSQHLNPLEWMEVLL